MWGGALDLLSRKAKGRSNDKQSVLYKNQGGHGIVDIAQARRCDELARQHGKGYESKIQARENWWVQGGTDGGAVGGAFKAYAKAHLPLWSAAE